MKYKKIALLAAAALTMTQMLGISAAAEEDVSSAEDSVVDADSLGSDESSEESFTSGDYTYFLDGENAKITKYNNSDETNVVVPDELDGHKVVSLGSGTDRDQQLLLLRLHQPGKGRTGRGQHRIYRDRRRAVLR